MGTQEQDPAEGRIKKKVDAARHRPEILVNRGQLREKVEQAVVAMKSSNDPPFIFMRGNIPTRYLDGDPPELEELDDVRLLAELSEAADFVKEIREERYAADPPSNLVRAIRGTRLLPFPPIEGIAHTPFFASDGQLISAPGYHRESRMYLALETAVADSLSKMDIPEAPSCEQVHDARALLLELIFDFPFADDASRAHALGLALLPLVRRMIAGPTPIHAVTAPPDAAGTGKGLLVQTACVPGIGEVPCAPEPGSQEELRKLLLPVIMQNTPVFLFDNVTRELRGGVLASILTASSWVDRVLGRSRMFRGNVCTTWIVTANGLRVSREIMRRTVWIRLDASHPEPWKRTGFKHELPRWARENRIDLIYACVVLVRNWITRGRPATKKCLGSFEQWAAIIGGILESAGISGFLDNSSDEAAHATDESGTRWQGFVEDWWHGYQEHPVLPASLIDLAYGKAIIREGREDSEDRRNRSSATRLGIQLSRRVGRSFQLQDKTIVKIGRASVVREGGRTDPGYALVRAEQADENVRDVRGGHQEGGIDQRNGRNSPPNVVPAPDNLAREVRDGQTSENQTESSNSRTSRTSRAKNAHSDCLEEAEIDRLAAADEADDDAEVF